VEQINKLTQEMRMQNLREMIEREKRFKYFCEVLGSTVPNETANGPLYYKGYLHLTRN